MGLPREVPGCLGRLEELPRGCQLPVISASGVPGRVGRDAVAAQPGCGPAFLQGVLSWA